jgi:DNA-binding transcriptional regulator GbsR (MarR family)
MDQKLLEARQNFILGMSRISQFWGFSKAMGAIFGALYLSPEPLCLDDLVKEVNVTKGAVSTNIRGLERLGMVHKHIQIGERRDFYTAETDFWKIAKGILQEREKSEFDRAIHTVDESLELVQSAGVSEAEAETAVFYQKRLQNIQSFFHALDNVVATVMALDNLRMGTIQKLFGNSIQE